MATASSNLSGQVDVFPSERRDLGKEFGRDLDAGELAGGAAHGGFSVFGAIAHFERRLISERTRDGTATAKQGGKRASR